MDVLTESATMVLQTQSAKVLQTLGVTPVNKHTLGLGVIMETGTANARAKS